jgi:hypothetical protein
MPVPPAGPPGFEPLNTLLQIIPLSGAQGLVLTPYAMRGGSQTLRQIGQNNQNIRRTVIGTLVNLTPPWFQQYASTITCSDANTPCLDDAWRGQVCEVHCAAELNYPDTGSAHRNVVSGSERQEGHIIFYRPVLIMMIMDIEPKFMEWEGQWTWRVDFEEVGLP